MWLPILANDNPFFYQSERGGGKKGEGRAA